MALRLRRGTANDRNQLVIDGDTLNVGEPLWVYDEGKLYVGDGTTPGGALVSGGDATVAGSNTQIQYNDNDALGASANFTFYHISGDRKNCYTILYDIEEYQYYKDTMMAGTSNRW